MKSKARTLCSYIFPAMGGLFVTYLYNVVDGIFVGQGVGSAALGAVNIGVPFITFVVAAAAMFPMGGATVVAIRMGRGDQDGANRAFMAAFILTAALSAILMAVGMIFPQQIVDISGARGLSGEMRKMAADYLFYYAAFSVPMLMSTCLSVFVRNDGSPALSFAGMCVGAVANIFLDWLFIFPLDMGVVGAAVASGLGQVFSVAVLLSHFVRKKGCLRIKLFAIDFALIRKICKRGIPEAISQLTTPVTALCYNLMLARLIGDIGVSTFSVLSFIYSLANAVLSGVAQGLQPIWGNCYGKRATREMNWFFRCGITINLRNQFDFIRPDLWRAVLVSRTGYSHLQSRQQPCANCRRSIAHVQPVIHSYGGQPDLYRVYVFHKADGTGQCNSDQPRGCRKSNLHFLCPHPVWQRRYLDGSPPRGNIHTYPRDCIE